MVSYVGYEVVVEAHILLKRERGMQWFFFLNDDEMECVTAGEECGFGERAESAG